MDRQPNLSREMTHTPTSNRSERTQNTLEGRSTLSFLTRFYQKEETPRRQAHAAASRDDSSKRDMTSMVPSPFASSKDLQPTKRQDNDATEDETLSVSSRRKSLPLKKRACFVGPGTKTKAGKENGKENTCGDCFDFDETTEKSKDSLEADDTTQRRRRSTTPSSLRYLDPAVLSALANRALKYSEPASQEIFSIGSSSIWSSGITRTDWSPFSVQDTAQGAAVEANKRKTPNEHMASVDKKAPDGHSLCNQLSQSQGKEDAPAILTTPAEFLVDEMPADDAVESGESCTDADLRPYSSLGYLDPAVLSALADHALTHNEPASQKAFTFGASSIWSSAVRSTDWSEFSDGQDTSQGPSVEVNKKKAPNKHMAHIDNKALDGHNSYDQLSQSQEKEDASVMLSESAVVGEVGSTTAPASTDSAMLSSEKLSADDAIEADILVADKSSVASACAVSMASSRSQGSPKSIVVDRKSTDTADSASPYAMTSASSVAKKPVTRPMHLLNPASRGSSVPAPASLMESESSSGRLSRSESFSMPPTKRRRISHVGKGKMSQEQGETNFVKSSITQVPLSIGYAGPKEVNRPCESGGPDHDVWMSDDVQGLVETEELPPIDTTPEGVNPWAYLWEPGAPSFEIEVISCAERRNLKGLVASLYSKS